MEKIYKFMILALVFTVASALTEEEKEYFEKYTPEKSADMMIDAIKSNVGRRGGVSFEDALKDHIEHMKKTISHTEERQNKLPESLKPEKDSFEVASLQNDKKILSYIQQYAQEHNIL